MATDYLTVREFDSWTQQLDAKMDRVLDHLEKQDERNLGVEARITALEVNQLQAGKLSAKISMTVGTIVAAIIAGVFQLLGATR